MMQPITDRLIWHGYIMPPGKTKYRDTCPVCSHTREKADKRCFVVKIIHPGLAWANCHHCHYRERIEA